MNRIVVGLIVGLAVALAVLPSVARADGMMASRIEVGRSSAMVASPRQEALLATDGTTVKVTLRTFFRKGAEELAWIVPVPGKPIEVTKSDDEVFASLERWTAPRFEKMGHSNGFHFGCGCDAPAGSVPLSRTDSITVEATGAAGIFDYTVLSATDPRELAKWLADNNYNVPVGSERVFDRYVKARWHWLAMKVRPEKSDRPTQAPHPITYTYKSDTLVYPMVISRLSADLTNEIVLWVASPYTAYACANWTNGAIARERVHFEAGSKSGTNYERLLREQTDAAGGRFFCTEYVGYYGAPGGQEALFRASADTAAPTKLTRLRAIMVPQAMDRDVILVSTANPPSPPYVYMLTQASPRPVAPTIIATAACCVLFAGAWLVGPHRRRPWIGSTFIVLACAALTMI